MRKFLRVVLASALALAPIQSYAGTSTITVKDASGVTQTFAVITNGSSQFGSITAVCDGTALASCLTITSGAATVIGSGSAGTAATGVVTVQGIASMTPVQVSQATSSNLKGQVDPLTSASWGLGATGAAVVANAMYNGINVGGNLTGWGGLSAGADATSNTAAGGNTFAYNLMYNGSTWDRIRGDTTNGVWVNVKNANANGIATAANSAPTVQAVDQVNSTTGNIVANNTTAVVVNAAATTLYGVQVFGIGSAPAYLKLYNATSATCGSGTPVKRIMIPAAATAANGAGAVIPFALGLRFSTGLTYCVTTGIGDADTTSPAASTFLVNLDWR